MRLNPCFVHQFPYILYFLTLVDAFVSPGFHYDVITEVSTAGCPLPLFMLAEDVSSDLNERSEVCFVC